MSSVGHSGLVLVKCVRFTRLTTNEAEENDYSFYFWINKHSPSESITTFLLLDILSVGNFTCTFIFNRRPQVFHIQTPLK